MDWIMMSYYNPLEILNGFLAFLCLILSINYFLRLRFFKKGYHPDNMENGIDYILLICFFMIFFISIDRFIGWKDHFTALSKPGVVGDPRIMVAGLSNIEIILVIHFAIITFFLIVWYLLRAYNLMNMRISGKN